MTTLGLSLLWSALQATILGLVAVLLGARPWRLGGAITPLVALLAIAILTGAQLCATARLVADSSRCSSDTGTTSRYRYPVGQSDLGNR